MYKITFTDPKLRQTFLISTMHKEVAIKYVKSLQNQGMKAIHCQNDYGDKL
jgi:hypothetical protein